MEKKPRQHITFPKSLENHFRRDEREIEKKLLPHTAKEN